LRGGGGADDRASQSRADGGCARAARRDAGARGALLGGLGGGGGAARVRALACVAARSVPGQPRPLQRQPLHRPDRVGGRLDRADVVMGRLEGPSITNAGLVRAMFTRIAGRYDLMNSIMTGGRHHAWRRVMARAAAGSPPGPILDLATGTAD